ncbi:Golgi apparatus membrane protein tvp18 [Linnemannia hyalina]|uniref:Golgi apparatus membrane protein tvp18 n=1 Tax=Linnemannia hyalina TaxID=64524 RepID=A0A9P7XZ42_9FUNG|nr:Golgi apparatus membrane protein tvp18 [Linnemannia hyalina]
MGLADEFRSGNFSLYGQWQVRSYLHYLIMAFLLVFIEIPLCLKCCPTSAKFDNALQQFQNSYFRAIAYVVFAVVMWLAVGLGDRTLQVVSALALSFGAVSYVIAAARHQTPASSTITGGTGVSTIV